MKHYKKTDGSVWAFELDGSQDQLITVDMTPCEKPTPAAPAFSDQRSAEIASYIETREKMCARVAGIGQRLARAGDTAGASSCDAVINALLDVPAHTSVVNATDLASLRLALKDRYLAAVGLASLSAKTEFKRYDK